MMRISTTVGSQLKQLQKIESDDLVNLNGIMGIVYIIQNIQQTTPNNCAPGYIAIQSTVVT